MNMKMKISKELAYLLGIIGGDGTIYIKKNKQYTILISDKCREVHSIFSKIFIKEFGYKPSLKFVKQRNTWYTVATSKKIADLLTKEFNISAGRNKTYHDKVPKQIIKATKEIKLAYLAGWIDAEGTSKIKTYKTKYGLYKYPCIVVEIVNKNVLNCLHLLSKQVKIPSTKPTPATRKLRDGQKPRYYICWTGFKKCKQILKQMKHPCKINKLILNLLLAEDQSRGLT